MIALKVVGACAVLLIFAATQETTIRVPLTSEQIDEVRFDATRVSAADVSRWVQLSEYGPYSEADLELRTCFGTESSPQEHSNDIQDARLQLQKFSQRIRALDPRSYPLELTPVVLHFRKQQSFWLWLNNRILAFWQTGDPSTLELKFDDVNLRLSCRSILSRIRNAKSRTEARHLACFEWEKCVIRAAEKQIGPYPRNAWKSFLSEHGIHEQILSTEND